MSTNLQSLSFGSSRSTKSKIINPKFLLPVRTILLLIASNIFMTFAWYYHLKDTGMALWKAILLSWSIAFFEYCLMVPANRLGYAGGFSAFQLKVMQEVITLVVFSVFAVLVLKEKFQWNYLVAFFFLLGAVYFVFRK
ncbi:MAG: rane protein [Flaviaesturariibacter sp.]|nr:rane protein [Flaviaesturariibacter sp.]